MRKKEYVTFLRKYTLLFFILHTYIKRTSAHTVPSQELEMGTLLFCVPQKESSAIETMLRIDFNIFKIHIV